MKNKQKKTFTIYSRKFYYSNFNTFNLQTFLLILFHLKTTVVN